MNEEAINYSYDLFKKDGYNGSLDEYKQLLASDNEAFKYSHQLFTKDGYNGTEDDYKALVLGSPEEESREVTPEVPKGEVAEESGALVSPSAGEESLSDSQPEINDDPLLSVKYPELFAERDALRESMNTTVDLRVNRPEQKRLDEIDETLKRLREPGRSSRAMLNDEIEGIDLKLNELELEANKRAQGTGMSFEDILNSDGTYQNLKLNKEAASSEKVKYDEAIAKIKEDTNSDFGNLSMLKNLARMVGYKETPDQVLDLDDRVEEQLALLIEGDNRLVEKLASGNASLPEKESLIREAKVNAVMQEKSRLESEAYELALSAEDPEVVNEKLTGVKEEYLSLLGSVGYDVATGILNNSFKKTDESEEFNERFGGGGFFHNTVDALSTFAESTAQIAYKGTVGFAADIMSGIMDTTTDQNSYSKFDAFADVFRQFGNRNIAPSSTEVGTTLLNDEGDINWTYKAISKSLAQTIPFTLAIVNDVRRGKISNIEASMGRLLNPTKSVEVTNKLKMIDSAYRHTLTDNLQMAEDLGLDDNQGRVFANVLSMAEGIAELVMPDTKFFTTGVGKGLLDGFKGNLQTASTKAAFSQAVKNFTKNVALELGEEEVVLATEDLLKYAMIVGHENSEFWDMNRQKELAVATIAMSGTLGGANIRRDFLGNKFGIYNEISTNINGITDELRTARDIAKTEEEKAEITNTIDWANRMHHAVTVSPKDVTGEQIDLLIEKGQLIEEMKHMDEAFAPQYKERLEALNARIAEAVPQPEVEAPKTPEQESFEAARSSVEDASTLVSNDPALEATYVENGYKPVAKVKSEVEGEPDNIVYAYDPLSKPKVGTAIEFDSMEEAQTFAQEQADKADKETAYTKLADAIRSNKVYKTPSEAMSKLSSNPAGLLTVAWDGALETIATSVEATGKLDAAVRKGLKQLKQSEWFKSLSPEGKKKAETLFTKETTEAFSPLAEAHVPKTKKSVKATIRETTGQVDTSEKVITTQNKQRREMYSNLQKGFKEGKKEMKQLKGDFVKSINGALKEVEGQFSKTEVRRILSAVNQLNESNIGKVTPLVERVFEAIEKRETSKKVRSAKSKVKKNARSKGSTPANIKELAKEAGKVNEKYLGSSDLNRYLKVLDKINAAFKPSTNGKYSMPNEDQAYATLNSLSEKAEEARLKELAETMGVEALNLTAEELQTLWETDDVDEFIENLSEAKKKEARTLLEKQGGYAIVALNDVDGTDLSLEEKSTLKDLKKADLKLMSDKDIRDFIKVADNIVENNNFSSSGDISSKVKMLSRAQEASKDISKKESGFIKDSTITDFKSLAMILKTVFKSGAKSARFNSLSGLLDLSMGYTKARKKLSSMGKEYDKLIKEIKRSKNRGITHSRNTLLRGITAQLIQGNTKEDFEINRSRMEDQIKVLSLEGSQDARRYLENIQEVYSTFDGLNSQEEVLQYVKDLNDGNYELLDYWLKYFEGMKESLKENTENVHGKGFEEVSANYLPIKLKFNGVSEALSDEDKVVYNTNGIQGSKPSPTTISRNKSKKLPKGRIIDLDFDSVMFNRANRVEIDINTSKQHKDVANFFNSPEMSNMFHAETVKVFLDKVNKMRDVQTGMNNISPDEALMRTASKVERTLKTIGTTIALGSITQYPKQYLSVAAGVMGRLGVNNMGLMWEAMFTDKSQIPLLNMVSVSMRGETQAGTVTATNRISEEEKRATLKAAAFLARETGQGLEKIRELLFTSLRTGDVNVARSSWVAFYKEYLIKHGVDKNDIDMMTEHEKMDEPKRRNAISYAELMVEETQISSDDSRGSGFYQSTDTLKSLFRGIFLPYQSFNINSKMRMITDFAIIRNINGINTQDEINESWRSLTGTFAEMVMFQGLKIYILSELYALGKVGIEALLGLETPDEDEEGKAMFKFKKFYSSMLTDFNPLAIGAFAEDLTIEIANWVHYLVSREDSDVTLYDFQADLKKNEGGLMFYKYGDKTGFELDILNDGGLYQIPAAQLGQLMDDAKLAFDGKMRDEYGRLYEYELTEEQQNFMYLAFVVDLLSTLGLGEADSTRIINSIKRQQVREAHKVKIN